MAATVTYVKGNFAEVDVSGNTTFRIPHAALENIFVGGTTVGVSGATANSEGTQIYNSGTGKIYASYITLPTITVEDLPSIPANKISGRLTKEQLPTTVDDITEVIAISTSAPAGTTWVDASGTTNSIATGDQYINTTAVEGVKGKIYTATVSGDTVSWGTGSELSKANIYYNLSSLKSYRWGGTDLVEVAATISVRIQGSTEGSALLAGSDDFVPTEKAVKTAIDAAAAAAGTIASGSAPGIVYVSGTAVNHVVTSSSNGVSIMLNDQTGALSVTADSASTGDPGVVQLVTDWQSEDATTFWAEGGGKDTTAATPNYVHMAFANGKGLTFDDTNKIPGILLDSPNPGLTFAGVSNALKVDLASSNPGLEISSGLKLKVFASHGLTVDNNGVYISTANGNGLEIDTNGVLKVKLKSTGSELVCNNDGIRTLMQWIPD